jgi:hypothetical protein
MSLQIAAQHLSSHGRGNDSTMVHMSPREVNSLNAIAKAHGGQLTTNPHTGLPEAGFLESILPMVAGAGLMAVSGGAINPMTAGLITGGLSFAMTGSLEKGLMAGLGAYGGAGLGESIAMQGVQAAAAPAAADLAGTGAMAQQSVLAQQEMAKQAALAAPIEGPTAQMLADHQALAGAGANSGAQFQAVQNAALTPEAAKMQFANMSIGDRFGAMGKGLGTLGQEGGISNLIGKDPIGLATKVGSALSPTAAEMMKPKAPEEEKADTDMGQRYGFSMNPTTTPFPQSDPYGREQQYFAPSYSKLTPEQAKSTYGYADGGVATDPDRPTETPALLAFKQMQAQRAAQPQAPQIDANAQYADYLKQTTSAPAQMPIAPPTALPNPPQLFVADADNEFIFDANAQRYIPNPKFAEAQAAAEKTKNKPSIGNIGGLGGGGGGGISMPQPFGRAAGGSISEAHYNLGGYSDGGRLLRGPGDGVSDSIPAVIGKKQPARLADGEFVVPARIVSELGNGSTEAGARKLYAMMDRIQKARGKTVGKGKVAKNSRSEKYLPA